MGNHDNLPTRELREYASRIDALRNRPAFGSGNQQQRANEVANMEAELVRKMQAQGMNSGQMATQQRKRYIRLIPGSVAFYKQFQIANMPSRLNRVKKRFQNHYFLLLFCHIV